MNIRSIADAGDIRGMTVLVRAALNVPVAKGAVTDGFRLEKALPVIRALMGMGAHIVLISHMSDATGSLKPVFEYLKKRIPLSYVNDVVGPAARAAVHALKDGEVLMLENLRWQKGEETNDEHFARELASLGDIFVNDDFTVAHRRHAGVVGITKFLPSYAGPQFLAEINGIAPALDPRSPSLAIVGGAKFVTKEPLLKTLLKKYDRVMVGGALANDFLAAKGYEVGRSVVSRLPGVSDLLKNSKLIVPEDVIVAGPDPGTKRASAVTPGDTIYDVGPASIAALDPLIEKARFVLWNGPMGYFEGGYTQGTEDLARRIAAVRGDSVVGGGDTLAAIQRLELEKRFSFVSTAGGAMLKFIADGTLPGIEAFETSSGV